MAKNLAYLLMEHTALANVIDVLKNALDTHLNASIPLFLSHFDRNPAPSKEFEAVLPRLVPFWATWADDKSKWSPSPLEKTLFGDYLYQISLPQFLTKTQYFDTDVKLGAANVTRAHAAILAVKWPFFAAHTVEVGPNQFELALPDWSTDPKVPGAVNATVATQLVSVAYGVPSHFIEPPSAFLFAMQSPHYGTTGGGFVSFCVDRVTCNMDLAQMLDVVLIASQLGMYEVPPTDGIPEFDGLDRLRFRILQLTKVLHEAAADATGYEAWQKLPAALRHTIMQGGIEATPPPRFVPSPIAPPLPLNHYPVWVRTLTGKTITIAPDIGTTVQTMKCDLQAKEGIPTDQQRIIHGGRQLEDGRSMGDYNVAPLSTMHLVLRLRG